MMHYPEFRARAEDVSSLLSDQRVARLLTVDGEGWPRLGLHVFTSRDLELEIHLVNADPQLDDIRRTGRAAIEVDEVMAFAPSHWVDAENASHADQFYRCAVFRGTVGLIAERVAIEAHLRALLARNQPEGGYADVREDHPLYAAYIGRLTLVRFSAVTVQTKFKLGQRTPADVRGRILAGLASRGSELDRRTATAIAEMNRGRSE